MKIIQVYGPLVPEKQNFKMQLVNNVKTHPRQVVVVLTYFAIKEGKNKVDYTHETETQ